MTSQTAGGALTAPHAQRHDSVRVATGRLMAAAMVSALLGAAASRPWGLGLLALLAFVPAFDAISRARTAWAGAALGAIASLGVASVAYEATAALGVHIYALALLLAPLPHAAAGAIAVRFGRAVVRRADEARAPSGSGAGYGARTPYGARFSTRRLAVIAALPVVWLAAEWLPAQPRLWGSFALSLGAIGYSQADLPTLHLASLSSVTAVSAAVVATNALLVVLWRTNLPIQRLAALTGLAGLGLLVAWRAQPVTATVAATAPAATAVLRLVQPNLPDSAYLAANRVPAARRALVDSLARLTAATGTSETAAPVDSALPPALTILPEAAWPGPLDASSNRPELVDPLLSTTRLSLPLVFGAPSTGSSRAEGGAAASPATRRSTWFANSAFLLTDGELTRVQDKLHLVPIAEAGLTPGRGPVVFDVGALRLAVLICYDVVFPATSRAAALAGATLVTVLTDDSFAARGDIPKLHLRLAVFRAVENGRPVAFASNTGPSALIDSSGRIVARTPALVTTALTAPLPLARRHTTYTAYGDWLGVITLLATLPIAAIASLRGGGAGSFGSRPT